MNDARREKRVNVKWYRLLCTLCVCVCVDFSSNSYLMHHLWSNKVVTTQFLPCVQWKTNRTHSNAFWIAYNMTLFIKKIWETSTNDTLNTMYSLVCVTIIDFFSPSCVCSLQSLFMNSFFLSLLTVHVIILDVFLCIFFLVFLY